MKKINVADVSEVEKKSPKGKYCRYSRNISVDLDAKSGHGKQGKKVPFDLMLTRVPPGAIFCPYHAHSAMWEMYLFVSGRGKARDAEGEHKFGPGDTFIYAPGEAHQIFNTGAEDLVYYVISDNPVGDSVHYPDSRKWAVYDKENRFVVQGAPADYWTDEE